MSRFTIISRLAAFAAVAGVCTWLNSRFGPWTAVGLWSAGAGFLCGLVALLMHRQPMGRVTIVNYAAGVVLPWGYRIGRGKLPPIVLLSWAGWTSLGAAFIIARMRGWNGFINQAGTPQTGEYHRAMVMTILLVASWVIDAAVVLRLITFLVMRANPNPIPPGTFGPILGILAILAASVALTIFGHSALTSNLALLLTGGPILLIAGGYALVLLAMLTFGRHTRWN
jgi:hypothetical protein